MALRSSRSGSQVIVRAQSRDYVETIVVVLLLLPLLGMSREKKGYGSMRVEYLESLLPKA